jgi:hypothetical protein
MGTEHPRLLRIRTRFFLFLALAVVGSACGGQRARTEAREVAIAFARALRNADTAAMRALSDPEHANSVVMGLPSVSDERLGFRKDRPEVEFRGSTEAQYNFLVRTESDTLDREMAGIWVVVKRTVPPGVRSYTLFPDIWPKLPSR